MRMARPKVATGPSEKELLREFWWFVSGTTDAAFRLDWLRRLSEVRVRVEWGWKPEEVRREWNQERDWHHGKCFVCGNVRTLQTHHVIQIQFGGSNHRRNRVTVCSWCHAAIHPWLRKSAARESYV